MPNSRHRFIFRELQLDGERSIAKDLSSESARGIYAYEFTDGTWYVGKSGDVRTRHQQHLHDWRHKASRPIPKRILFARIDGDDLELDNVETEAIAAFEKKGYSLRNIMKTGTPGGPDTLEVEVRGGFGVSIPWDRDARPRAALPVCNSASENRTPRLKARFKKLASSPYWSDLPPLLARYVSETVPAPDKTACSLWSATCMGTRHTRSGASIPLICCLSFGNIEGLTITEDEYGLGGFMNMKSKKMAANVPFQSDGIWISPMNYRSANNVSAATFDSLQELQAILNNRTMLDGAYRLNAEMMRRGSCMYARRSNAYLTNAILAEIKTSSEGSISKAL